MPRTPERGKTLGMISAVLACVLAATISVPTGAPVAEALRRARAGDVVMLAAGVHQAALRLPPGVTLAGAGEGVTVLEAPEGEPAVVVDGAATLADLTLRAGPAQCALRVDDGGEVVVRDSALTGGACGASIAAGQLEAERVDLRGGRYGIEISGGRLLLRGGTLRGAVAGLAVQRGSASVSDAIVFGQSREAAVTISGGDVTLAGVVIASPGPVGIAVAGGRLRAQALTVGGASQRDGPAACVEALGGELSLAGSELVRCGGAGVVASGAKVKLDGVDVEGGASGCIVLVDGTTADLQGVRCTGRGPGLLAANDAAVQLRMNRWLVDPTLVVECGTGARVKLVYGEDEREPCASAPASRPQVK